MAENKSYTERKEAWAAKMREKGAGKDAVRSGDRLPPGQHLTGGFPVLDLGIRPEVPLKDWRLTISGEVEKPTVLDWDDLEALPRVESVSDFHCVTTWSKFDCAWSGVPMSAVLDLAMPREGAVNVFFTGFDGYTTNVRLEDLYDDNDDVLLASAFDGKPLTREHGGPVRVIIPMLYAWKSAKFVREIAFHTEEELGYWEKRGYSNTADPWSNDRFS